MGGACRTTGGALLALASLLVITIGCGGNGSAPVVRVTPTTADEAAVIETIVAAATALNERDATRLEPLVGDDFVSRRPGETLEEALARASDSFRIEDLLILTVEVEGDRGVALIRRTIDGQPTLEEAYLIREESRWLLQRVVVGGAENDRQ